MLVCRGRSSQSKMDVAGTTVFFESLMLEYRFLFEARCIFHTSSEACAWATAVQILPRHDAKLKRPSPTDDIDLNLPKDFTLQGSRCFHSATGHNVVCTLRLDQGLTGMLLSAFVDHMEEA